METEATKTGTLVAMEELVFVPNTIVAFDLANCIRVAGAIVSVESHSVILQLANSRLEVPKSVIVKGWWAPAGYRPCVTARERAKNV